MFALFCYCRHLRWPRKLIYASRRGKLVIGSRRINGFGREAISSCNGERRTRRVYTRTQPRGKMPYLLELLLLALPRQLNFLSWPICSWLRLRTRGRLGMWCLVVAWERGTWRLWQEKWFSWKWFQSLEKRILKRIDDISVLMND